LIAERGEGAVSEIFVTAEELLAGAALTFDVTVPRAILRPSGNGAAADEEEGREARVRLRPLTIGTFQLIMKASRDDPALIPLLMIKEALVEPALGLDQVRRMHLGLVNVLIANIRQISGLTEKKTP